jgi:ABC-2 type transport system permease protein
VRLLRVELLKLVRRPASYVVLVVLLAVIALFYLALGASASAGGDLGGGGNGTLQVRLLLAYPNSYRVLLGFVLSFGGLLAVCYGAAVGGAEWAWGTIRTVIARGESRPRYAILKFVAVTLLLALGIVVTFVIGAALSLVAAGMAGAPTEGAFSAQTLSDIPQLLARTWLGVSEEAAIGFAIAMLFRSQLAGIGAGLALYFGEIFLALVPGIHDVLPYLPFNVAQAVVGSVEGMGSGGSTVRLDSTTALLVSGLYMLLAVGIAAVALWRADITA